MYTTAKQRVGNLQVDHIGSQPANHLRKHACKPWSNLGEGASTVENGWRTRTVPSPRKGLRPMSENKPMASGCPDPTNTCK